MNNLKYKGLVILTVPGAEAKWFYWKKTVEKLSHSDPKKQGKHVLHGKDLGENSIVQMRILWITSPQK